MKLLTREEAQRVRGEHGHALAARLHDLQIFQRALPTPSEEIAAEIQGIERQLDLIARDAERDERIANMPTDWRFLGKFMLGIFAVAALLLYLLAPYIG